MLEFSTHPKEDIMSRILAVRYVDLDQEWTLCEDLLLWAIGKNDTYGTAFALTYLGDYYLALRKEEEAGEYLLKAENMLLDAPSWYFLRLQLYSFLGIYYDVRADEKNATDYYLKTISLSESIHEIQSRCVALNNLATIFSRYNSHEEALKYYQKAYQLQKEQEESPQRPVLLVNLAETYLNLDKKKEAKKCIELCEQIEKERNLEDIYSSRGWCSYYAVMGEKEKAIRYAQRFLDRKNTIESDKLTAFDSFLGLYERMTELGDAHYAGCFLRALEEVGSTGGLEQREKLEEAKIRHILLFEPLEKHAEAYRRFYEKNLQFRHKVKETVAEAMKAKIYLDKLVRQKQRMKTVQKTLEAEVQIDELTSIYNRRFMEALLQANTGEANAAALGMIVLDVDYFKEYNDFYGHLMGDMALKEVANCLKMDGQIGVYPCRFGGDEFACVCIGLTAQEVETYICSVRQHLYEAAIEHKKSPCSSELTLSIGYVVAEPETQVEGHFLFQLADKALYQSKRSGRNTYTRSRVGEI